MAVVRDLRALVQEDPEPDWADAIPGSLRRALDAVPAPEDKTAAHLGCATGTVLPVLAARFRRVLGIDSSAAMLSRARAAWRAGHVSFHRADLIDLTAFRGRLDVAVTVNAVFGPDDDRLERIFESVHGTLRPRGVLIAIVPAMEAVLHQGFLVRERERRTDPGHGHTPRTRVLEAGAHRLPDPGRYDRGQKFFHGFELRHRLRHAGFRRVRLGRVFHPRTPVFDAHPEPPMWDWLVRAET